MPGSLQRKRKCIIAFDPSINETGIAVLNNGNALVFSGVIKTEGESLSEKLSSLLTEVGRLFDLYTRQKLYVWLI